MQSNDPGHFFQTEAAMREAARREQKSANTDGKPVKLGSKGLALALDPTTTCPRTGTAAGTAAIGEPCVLVAESGGRLSRIGLDSGRTYTHFVGPAAPLTSLAVSGGRVYAGCWDKRAYSWDLSAPAQGADDGTSADPPKTDTIQPGMVFSGHADFVKDVCVLSFGNGQDLLLSGGMDSLLHIHNAETGDQLAMVRGHTRGIQCIAVDPVLSQFQPADGQTPFAVVFTGDSKRDILQWKIEPSGRAVPLSFEKGSGDLVELSNPAPLVRHETSVYRIVFDEDGDMWTSSADLSVKCLSREKGFDTESSLVHSRFVQDVLVNDTHGLICSACDNEDIWVWNKASDELAHTLSGHYAQVSALTMVGPHLLVSASLDCTIRQWRLDQLPAPGTAEKKPEQKKEEAKEEAGRIELTTEEEAELAELMSDSD